MSNDAAGLPVNVNAPPADGNAPNLTIFTDRWPVESLTQRVQDVGIDASSPFAGDNIYETFFDTLARALHRTNPRHVLLVRERGVGEQAALLELARRGMTGEPPFLRSKQIIAADCRRLPAEDMRSALLDLLNAVVANTELILCLDGIASLLHSQGPVDYRSLLLSRLARSRGRVIGILSPQEYEEYACADAQCQELFTVVRLHEPQGATAERLVRHFADGLQNLYDIQIDDEAVHRSVALTSNCILHERLPHKAVKVLQAICDDAAYERSQRNVVVERINEGDVVTKVAHITGVPAETLAGVGERVDYAQGLAEWVVGQDQAVHEAATELGLIKAGLVDTGKPASVMLFIGQTGTGKTELAKALARFYSPSKRVKTFTLGNFSEPHSVSGIIGVPAGYVGHDQGGRLVNELNADPYSVFLLDEADKAHPDVMQPFLNLFDEGWILDQRGTKAYADRAIFILTTNVGQRQIAEMCRAGKSIEEITATMKDSLSRIRHSKSNRPVFSPEFLARIKRIIVFRSLDEQAMAGICRKLAGQLSRHWQSQRQKELRIPEDLLGAIARQAYLLDQKAQGKEGGRIVRKLLADTVESRIQKAISEAPEAYRASRTVVVEYRPPEAVGAEPNSSETVLSPNDIVVRFESEQDHQS